MVGFYNDALNQAHSFKLSGKTYTNIDVPWTMGVDTNVTGINSYGDTVGVYLGKDSQGFVSPSSKDL
jgi:hypothetical protein